MQAEPESPNLFLNPKVRHDDTYWSATDALQVCLYLDVLDGQCPMQHTQSEEGAEVLRCQHCIEADDRDAGCKPAKAMAPIQSIVEAASMLGPESTVHTLHDKQHHQGRNVVKVHMTTPPPAF